MNGLVFDGRLTHRTDLPTPDPTPGEALVRVTVAGICRTDLEIVDGYMNFRGILGHEFVGTLITPTTSLKAGARVTGEINAACGTCPRCRSGRHRHCSERTVLGIAGRNGVFADYLVLPERNLHVVPDSIEDDDAVFVEPLAAAMRIAEQIPVTGRIAVFGDGRLGHLVAWSLRDAGGNVTVVGRHTDRLTALRADGLETAGADTTLSDRFPVTVDCTGTPDGFRSALEATEPTGTLVLKSTFHGSPPMDLAPVVIDEVTIVGSRCGRFEPALEALRDGRIPVGRLVEGSYPLERGVEAFEHARRTLKLLLRIG